MIMTQPTTVRRLAPADVADYVTIRLSALGTAPEAFGAMLADEQARPIEQHAARLTSSIVLGAYDGARIVGMIGLRQETGAADRHKAVIWGFFVEPAWQGQGTGRALLAALIAIARGMVEQLHLIVVVGNAPAIALYRRFGLSTYGVAPRSLKRAGGYVDEELMFLDLMSPASGTG